MRQVHEALSGDTRARYTTTLKQMQVMVEKRLVQRDESRRSHVYSALVEETGTEQSVIRDFVDRVFHGSMQKMLVHAIESDSVTEEEIAEIKRLIRNREKKQK